jgi:3alpha(or 20beta)-hydroxysteroid dehydrogenase
MGASHARLLTAEGAKVVVADILDDDGAALAADIGDAARYVHLDVSDSDQWAAAVATTLDQFGTLNVLVNKAGIVNGSPIQKFDLAKWQKVIDVNLTGTFLGIRPVADPMIAACGGSIMNVSSIEGLRGTLWSHADVASKWAVRPGEVSGTGVGTPQHPRELHSSRSHPDAADRGHPRRSRYHSARASR